MATNPKPAGLAPAETTIAVCSRRMGKRKVHAEVTRKQRSRSSEMGLCLRDLFTGSVCFSNEHIGQSKPLQRAPASWLVFQLCE